jgi:hypothetical protein
MTTIRISAFPIERGARTFAAAALLLLFFSLPVWSAGTCTEFVNDGSFEDETTFMWWKQTSTTFESPLCDLDMCGYSLARTGAWWAWFGGTDATPRKPEVGTLEQIMTFPAGGSIPLKFHLWTEESGTTGDTDYIRVTIDGNIMFSATASNTYYQTGYTPVTINISAYADGQPHTVRFESEIHSTSSFFIDDVLRPDIKFVNNSRTLDFAGDLLQPLIAGNLPVQEARGQSIADQEDILVDLEAPGAVLYLKGGYSCDFSGLASAGSTTSLRSLEVRSGQVTAENISVASPLSMTGLVINPGGAVLARNLILKQRL